MQSYHQIQTVLPVSDKGTVTPQLESSSLSQVQFRQVNFEFPDQIKRYWLGNSPFRTHLFNSLHLFLPDIERWIIRNIKRTVSQIKEPLKQDLRVFIQQEGQHSSQHAKFWDKLRQQGYQLEQFLAFENNVLSRLDKLGLILNLAAIAGFEHITTLIAEIALKNNLLAEAEPNVKEILEWHAQEEIEHQSIAFDVLKATSDSYLIRVAGLVIGHLLAIVFLNLGLVVLLSQDKKLWNHQVWQEMGQFWLFKDKVLLKAVLNFCQYLKISFHPTR